MELQKKTSEKEELFLALLEEGKSITEAAEGAGYSRTWGYKLAKKLKDEIIDRQRDRLSVATIKATDTMIEMLDADSSTEKGELRLKAAESVLSRTGITNHTSVEVQVESENGVFILPGKTEVPKPEDLPE